MKELLLFIVGRLVDHPDDVVVNEVTKDDELVLELTVNQEDMGKVIGRQGRIAKAIRTLVKTAATRENLRVNVEILG